MGAEMTDMSDDTPTAVFWSDVVTELLDSPRPTAMALLAVIDQSGGSPGHRVDVLALSNRLDVYPARSRDLLGDLERADWLTRRAELRDGRPVAVLYTRCEVQ
jgi:hypothetical protein